MSTVIIRHRLPSGLVIERRIFDDGQSVHFITGCGEDRIAWDIITDREYNALLPLGERVA